MQAVEAGEGQHRLGVGAWLIALLAWAAAGEAAATASPPGAELVITRAGDGQMTAAGSLPAGLDAAGLAKLLPGLSVAQDLATARGGDAARWRKALEALGVVLPRLGAVRIRLRPGRLFMQGQLRSGVSLTEVRPALRAALGGGWKLDLQLSEIPPDAALTFEHDAGGTRLSGMLPAGISPRQALTAIRGATDSGLTSGARGGSSAWVRGFAVIDTLLSVYDRATGRFSASRGLVIDGQLAPGQRLEPLTEWAEDKLPEGWSVTLSGRTVPAVEGATRLDPVNRRIEILRDGSWLPVFDFAVSAERCTAEARQVQSRRKLTFATGAASLDDVDAGPVDALAGLARHCLRGSHLVLEVGGHTDSVGAPESNRALSQKRAENVRAALVARGVPENRVHARGYGASEPVASDDTAQGRARNRRISFDFRRPPPPGEDVGQEHRQAETEEQP